MERWTKGYGYGLTGPNTPSCGGVTCGETVALAAWKENPSLPFPESKNYYVPISMGTDTVAIAVGPNREKNANLIAAAPELLEACRDAARACPIDAIACRLISAINKAEGRYL